MAYLIRRCEPADNAEWARLRHALWPHGGLDEHRAEIETGLPGNVLRGYLAFDLAGETVGFAEISIRRYANGSTRSPVPFLEGIWIADEHRRHGIGRLLIENISEDCAAEGFVELCSDADIANLASHHAHQRWGFAETERVVYFRKAL
ncbi:N-acetyltransferase family protein [Rhizobium panacihumi]|uniref:GNAT family N-acetyltransferase n=1 Tax=Rhizobium panacihumi TaxID=2008450 RepID=UPI003D7A96D6